MNLLMGTQAPVFKAWSPINPSFAFSSIGGRYVVLAFLPAPGPERDAALQMVIEQAALFEDGSRVFFGVLPDQASIDVVRDGMPLRWFGDAEGEIRRLYKAVDANGDVDPQWIIVDPSMRILGGGPLARGREILRNIGRLGPPDNHAGVPLHAPVLIAPRVFERDFCRQLIAAYGESGGAPSGVMREQDGKTVGVLDDFKKRRDHTITDPGLAQQARARIAQRLIPEIQKVFQYEATRIERYIVACYDAEDGGYFRPHRDNTTSGTAHRRFAVSINLNAEEFEGGDLRFPEFGQRTYRPPTGGAVVFSCSLLHEATPVTKGTRYAFLPFLFDEAAEKIREANAHKIVAGLTPGGAPAQASAG